MAPSPIRQAQRLRWRRAQGFMNAAQIVTGAGPCGEKGSAVQLSWSKCTDPNRQLLPLWIRLLRGAPALRFFYKVRYRIRFYDHAMRGAVAKGNRAENRPLKSLAGRSRAGEDREEIPGSCRYRACQRASQRCPSAFQPYRHKRY